MVELVLQCKTLSETMAVRIYSVKAIKSTVIQIHSNPRPLEFMKLKLVYVTSKNILDLVHHPTAVDSAGHASREPQQHGELRSAF